MSYYLTVTIGGSTESYAYDDIATAAQFAAMVTRAAFDGEQPDEWMIEFNTDEEMS